ncbi:MAG: hypothetical protein ACOYMG_07335 [Candidatus Methylumidiphilus sp.]
MLSTTSSFRHGSPEATHRCRGFDLRDTAPDPLKQTTKPWAAMKKIYCGYTNAID